MINFPLQKIVPLCREFGVELNDEQLSRLNTYGNLLIEWNEKINLTAITEPDEVVIKHFVDSISLLSAVTPEEGAKVLD